MSLAPPPNKVWLPQTELKTLHATLAHAHDSQLGRLVAMLDAMPDRGTLDELIAPLRPRLAQLRPDRPLRFNRLLFLPLDPLIVPPARWQQGAPTIPRSALAAMAEVTRAALSAECQVVDRMIAGQTSRATPVIARAGAVLWPAAAQALARSDVPAGWAEHTRLPPACYPEIARNTAAVLEQVLRLHTVVHQVELGAALEHAPFEVMLRAVRLGRPEAFTMLVTLILARLPQAAPLLLELPEDAGGGRVGMAQVATGQAHQALIERLETESGTEAAVMGVDLSEVATEVRRIAVLLRGVHTAGPPARRRQMERLLQRLDTSCVARFTAGLEAELLRPLEALGEQADDGAIIRLEEAARSLFDLAHEGCAIGSRNTYLTLLRQTADAVKAIKPGGALLLADRVRLVEILVGSEEAWAMLEPAPTD